MDHVHMRRLQKELSTCLSLLTGQNLQLTLEEAAGVARAMSVRISHDALSVNQHVIRGN